MPQRRNSSPAKSRRDAGAQASPKQRRVKSTLYVSPGLLRLIQNLQYYHLQQQQRMISQQALIVQALIAYAENLGVDIPKGVA